MFERCLIVPGIVGGGDECLCCVVVAMTGHGDGVTAGLGHRDSVVNGSGADELSVVLQHFDYADNGRVNGGVLVPGSVQRQQLLVANGTDECC